MKKYKIVIFWVVFIAVIFIAVKIGGSNYCYGDNLHDIPIITRLVGMIVSLLILTFFLGIIGITGKKDV